MTGVVGDIDLHHCHCEAWVLSTGCGNLLRLARVQTRLLHRFLLGQIKVTA
jgi:hypothetical protein